MLEKFYCNHRIKYNILGLLIMKEFLCRLLNKIFVLKYEFYCAKITNEIITNLYMQNSFQLHSI